MRLFTLDESYSVVIEPQTVLLQPFAALIKRDKSKTKVTAKRELAFVWFYADIKSDYAEYSDLDDRRKAIVQDLGLKSTWEIDDEVQAAIEYYEEMSTSLSSNILRRSRFTADKLSEKLETAVKEDDLSISDMDRILASINRMPETIKSLQAAEKAVLKEIQEAQDRLGSREKAAFEDGL